MPSPDELAEKLWRASFPVTADRFEPLTEKGLHQLARDAATQALLGAAEEAIEFSPNGRYVADWLRTRAGQIGN